MRHGSIRHPNIIIVHWQSRVVINKEYNYLDIGNVPQIEC